jgi:hypothetical protein
MLIKYIHPRAVSTAILYDLYSWRSAVVCRFSFLHNIMYTHTYLYIGGKQQQQQRRARNVSRIYSNSVARDLDRRFDTSPLPRES